MHILGIDIGGSGVKGGVVDIEKGGLVGERLRIPTPEQATPQAVQQTVADLVREFSWSGPIGCGFPAVIRAGRALTAANVDPGWIGTDAAGLFAEASGCPAGSSTMPTPPVSPKCASAPARGAAGWCCW